MAGKLRAKPYNPATDPLPVAVHDRKSTDITIGVQGHETPMLVDDPLGLEPGEQVVVLRNLRTDPLARLHAGGHIDEAQYQGGRAYQAYFERAGTSIQAIDYGKPQVDGGLPPESGASDSRMKAFNRLIKGNKALGAEGTVLVQQILVHGMSMEQAANSRGHSGKAAAEYFGRRFRECLETLAWAYGLTNGVRVMSSGT